MTIIASIYGRAGYDGELRTSAAGKPWARLNVACMAGSDRETQEALTLWISVVGFGRQAEELAKVTKGQTVSVMGRVEQNKWTAQSGEEREGLSLIADAVLAVKTSRPGGGTSAQGRGQGQPQRRQQGRVDPQAPTQGDAFEEELNDDIPF